MKAKKNIVGYVAKAPKPGTIGWAVINKTGDQDREVSDSVGRYRSPYGWSDERRLYPTYEDAKAVAGAWTFGPFTFKGVVLRVVRRHKQKPGTIGYVLKSDGRHYLEDPRGGYCTTDRSKAHVFPTRAEAEANLREKDWDVTNRIVALVRRPKPGRFVVRYYLADHPYLMDQGFCAAYSRKDAKVFNTWAEANAAADLCRGQPGSRAWRRVYRLVPKKAKS